VTGRSARVAPGARDAGGARVRREALLERIHAQGEDRVAALAAAVGASEVTVRRDLVALERQGLVDRTWGGARSHVALHYRGDQLERAARGEAAKRAVAAAAAQLVAPNMVVALSGGTTLTLLARLLRGRPLNVVTNAVNVAAELHGHGATKVIVTGGALKANSYELVGAAADAIIRAYHVDLGFFSCSGVDEAGYGRRDHAEAAIVRAFRRAAARTVMLIDQGKLDRGYRARVAALGEVDQVIVDGPLPPIWRERLAAGRTEVLEVAPCDTGAP
jgi:DeoR family transcriptional regulator, aga operon transcriptional repressor